MTMTILEAALRYREIGWSVIPMIKADKRPHIKWKKYQTELPSEKDLRYWFGEKWPNANIALICGGVSGVFAIDLDSAEALEYYKAVYDADVEDTMCQITGRDGCGLHAIFNTLGKEIPLVQPILKKTDLKGDGSYIVVEPSIHETGRLYKWGHLNPLTDGIDDILDPPNGFYTMLEDHRRAKDEKNTTSSVMSVSGNIDGWEQTALMGVGEGERDTSAAKLTGLYLGKDYDQKDTLALLLSWNLKNTPPLDEKEIEKTVKSIYSNQEKKNVGGISDAVEKITILRYPDGKNKYRMYLGHGRSTLLSMEDLMSSRRTIIKIADTTKIVFHPPKQGKWLNLIQIWLNTAEEQNVAVEESELGIIKEIISEWLVQWNKQKDSEHLNLAAMINNNCVVEDRTIYFTLTHLEEDLRFRNMKMTRTLLCEFLKRLGANVTEPRKRFSGARIRTWDIKEISCE